MVRLRATAKVLRSLTRSEPVDTPSDTALGDWFANRLVIARIPILLMVSSRSLLPILFAHEGCGAFRTSCRRSWRPGSIASAFPGR